MRWAFVQEITGTSGGEWALVRVGEPASTVQAFATRRQAVAAFFSMSSDAPGEAFTTHISSPAAATWALVWAGDEREDTHVLGCLTNHDALIAMAELVERCTEHPTAAADAARLRAAAALRTN